MISLKPLIHETIWGGTRLRKYVDDDSNTIGHLYLVNGHSNMSNIVDDGEYDGVSLWELFLMKKALWGMEEFEEFPLTVALVDATDSLSIQVHPSADAAYKIEGKKWGKEESWLFLEASQSGWIYAGCRATCMNDVEKAIEELQMERITDRALIKKGDYVCIKPGMLHAMTAGCITFEVEFGSDFTYRFYDYNRRNNLGEARELHIEKAKKSLSIGKKPEIQHPEIGKWLKEENYEMALLANIEGYTNGSDVAEIISELDCGKSYIVEPKEKLNFNKMVDRAVVVRLRVS